LSQLAGAVAVLAVLHYVDFSDVGRYWYAIAALVIVLPPLFVALVALVVKAPTVFMVVTPSSPDKVPGDPQQTHAFLHRLKETGLEPIEPWAGYAGELSYLVLQHPTTSDIGVLLVSQELRTFELLRRRGDGSWLETAALPGAIDWVPDRSDNRLNVRAGTDPLRLWHAHQVRVARDLQAVRNPRITDPVAFLNETGAGETARLVSSGYMVHSGGNRTRATLKGALLMGLRAASPWTLFNLWRGQRTLRMLLNTGGFLSLRERRR
jgi:hypothetical protein